MQITIPRVNYIPLVGDCIASYRATEQGKFCITIAIKWLTGTKGLRVDRRLGNSLMEVYLLPVSIAACMSVPFFESLTNKNLVDTAKLYRTFSCRFPDDSGAGLLFLPASLVD
jgi:hypothetical protein